MYSFSQRIIYEWNMLSKDRVNASSVNMPKTPLTRKSQEGGLRINETFWTLDKSMASLSTCHLSLCLGHQ